MQFLNPAEDQALERKKKLEDVKRQVFSQYLTKEARERLSNLRYAHQDLADAVENMLLQAALSNQLKEIIDDKKLKELLMAMSGEKKDSKINFK
jgi:DNA-binding protein